MDYVTVSARIRRELYEKLKKYEIAISDVTRKALEEEVRKREEEEVREIVRSSREER